MTAKKGPRSLLSFARTYSHDPERQNGALRELVEQDRASTERRKAEVKAFNDALEKSGGKTETRWPGIGT
jgi:hypothetical protein